MDKLKNSMVLLGMVVMLVGGCGGGAGPLDTAAEPDFTLSILPETAVHGTSECAWDTTVEPTADGCIVSVVAAGADSQKALYFDLAYDADALHPVAAEPVAGVADCEPLSISILDDRGTVHYGMILPSPDKRTGFSGDGVMATVEFEYGAAECSRRVSGAPIDGSSAVLLRDTYPATLEWLYTNKGDCNQDGLVNAADLTPIGQNYSDGPDVVVEYYVIDSSLWMVDTNGDGVIGIGDITAIGQNYENSVLGGYDVYKADGLVDYPAGNPDGASSLELVANVPYQDLQSAPGSRHSFSFDVPDPVNRKLYWIVPKDTPGSFGAASQPISQIGMEAPRGDLSAAELTWDVGAGMLRWDCFLVADTNYDGAVRVSDLTPIGQFDMTTAPFASFLNELADANMDGIVDPRDMDTIFLNYGDRSIGYNVYSSLAEGDYPAFNDERELFPPVDALYPHFWQEGYDGPRQETRYFLELVIATPVSGTYYWVRHIDEWGGVGTPSNMIQIP